MPDSKEVDFGEDTVIVEKDGDGYTAEKEPERIDDLRAALKNTPIGNGGDDEMEVVETTSHQADDYRVRVDFNTVGSTNVSSMDGDPFKPLRDAGFHVTYFSDRADLGLTIRDVREQ